MCMCACVSFSIPALHNAPVCSPLYWSGFGIPGEQAGAQAASLSALCKTSEPWPQEHLWPESIRLSPFVIYSSTQNCLTTISARVHGYSVTQPPPLIPRQNKLSVDKVLDLILLPRVQQALVLELKSTIPLFDNKSH